jgi:hypothetical protein
LKLFVDLEEGLPLALQDLQKVSIQSPIRSRILHTRYFNYTVNDWEATKSSVPVPNVNLTKLPLMPIISSSLFTLSQTHQQAQKNALEKGIIMQDYDVIMKVCIANYNLLMLQKARPDVYCYQLFDVNVVREYFKQKPYTLISARHVPYTWWESTYMSDVVYITSKAAMDKITDPSFVTWLEAEQKRRSIHLDIYLYPIESHAYVLYIYFERGLPPEWIYREWIRHQGIQLKIVPASWTCAVWRMGATKPQYLPIMVDSPIEPRY